MVQLHEMALRDAHQSSLKHRAKNIGSKKVT